MDKLRHLVLSTLALIICCYFGYHILLNAYYYLTISIQLRVHDARQDADPAVGDPALTVCFPDPDCHPHRVHLAGNGTVWLTGNQ